MRNTTVIVAIVVVGLVVPLIGRLAQGAAHSPSIGPAGEASLDILKLRYGKGEITMEQLEEMKRIMSA